MKKISKLIKSIRNRYVNILYIFKSVKYFQYIVKASNIQITGTGVLHLYFDNHIIKIPLGKLSTSNLEKEYKNYLKLKKSSLSRYVDYKLKKIDNYYKVEKLKVVVNITNIDKIIQALEKETVKEDDYINLSLDLLNKRCDENFQYNFQYENSVMHGDLTPKNIMLNSKNQLVFIDLDRFSFNGIKGVDKLHFLAEKECKEQKIDFFDWFLKNFNKYDIQKLFIYFVYRINVENFENLKLPKVYYKKACKIFTLFLRKLN